MKYGTFGTLIKRENDWIIRVDYLDGSEDYSFPTQTSAREWAYRASIKIEGDDQNDI